MTARLLLAHPADLSAPESRKALARLAAGILSVWGARHQPAVMLTTTRFDWDSHFIRCRRSWDGWAADMATRVDLTSRQPVYTVLIVVPQAGLRVGRGVAAIVWAFQKVGKPVWLYLEPVDETTGDLRPCYGVAQDDPSDFKAGWKVA